MLQILFDMKYAGKQRKIVIRKKKQKKLCQLKKYV